MRHGTAPVRQRAWHHGSCEGLGTILLCCEALCNRFGGHGLHRRCAMAPPVAGAKCAASNRCRATWWTTAAVACVCARRLHEIS
jgi:hypothetical protein